MKLPIILFLISMSAYGFASISTPSTNQQLIDAAQTDNTTFIKDLIEHQGACVNTQGYCGISPLHQAAAHDQSEVVELLIHQGAEIELENNSRQTALHTAAYSGALRTLQKLIDYKANVNARNCIDATPLHLAASQGHTKALEILLNNGAEVNARNKSRFTPLHLAARHNHVRALEFLLLYGAHIKAYTPCRLTALHSAVFHYKAKATEILIAYNAPANEKINCHPTYKYAQQNQCHLLTAVIQDDARKIVHLLNKGAYANSRVKLYFARKTQELFDAIGIDDVTTVIQLLKHGCSLKSKDRQKNTLLHLACKHKSKNTLQLLLSMQESREHLSKENTSNLTPIELAVTTSTNHFELLQELVNSLNTSTIDAEEL
ncbi:ankyrin repeat domain-containing protein [Candidatus Dependentiae bacterium]|nr:ankyrin repeat domain-containing protein [Candidatus Dependentiae bacterium]